jgi:hypothetical protein
MAKIYNRTTTTDKILILGVREGAVQPFYAPGWTDLRFGGFFSVVKPPSVTFNDGVSTNGSPTYTSASANFGSSDVGAAITGTNIQSNTTILAVGSSTSITLSQNATASGSGLAFTILNRPSADDDPALTGMPETITGQGNLLNFFFIGLSTQNQQQFIGFSNLDGAFVGDSQLTSSDLGVGTSGHYWRPTNVPYWWDSFTVLDNGISIANAYPGINAHFYQNVDPGNPAPAGYYCGMLGFRLTRPDANSRTITVFVPNPAVNSADMFWTNAPTAANLMAKLQTWPTTGIQQVGPVTLSAVPDSIYLFWPFSLSRLRCSAFGVFRTA